MLRTSTSSRRLRLLLLAVTCAALPQTVVAADALGNAGYVQELVLNNSKSDRFIEFQGSVLLVEGDSAKSLRREYRWGGTACSGFTPTDAQVNFLYDVLRSARALQVVPSYKSGAGGARCLVSIKLRPRPASGAPPPDKNVSPGTPPLPWAVAPAH